MRRQAAIDDASGSRKYYSTEYEQDFTAEEEAYWRAQMDAAEEAQFDAGKELIDSELGSALLGEIADGEATNQTYNQLQEFAAEAGLESEVTEHIVALAESETPEPNAARTGKVSGEPETATTGEGRPLSGEYIDEEGTLRSETGEPLFRRRESESSVANDDYMRVEQIAQNLRKIRSSVLGRQEQMVRYGLRLSSGRELGINLNINEQGVAYITIKPLGRGRQRNDMVMGKERLPVGIKTLLTLKRYLLQAHPNITKITGQRNRRQISLTPIRRTTPEPLRRRGEPTTSPTEPISREGSRITINTETRDALVRAGVFEPGDSGLTMNPTRAERAADRLAEKAKTSPEDAKVWRRIARHLNAATNLPDVTSVIIATPEALQHEAFHGASARGANRGRIGSEVIEASLRGRHARFDELTEHPAYQKASPILMAAGYRKDKGVLVEEMAAHIAEGAYKDIGLTRKQALDFMQLWFESFAERNGDVTLDHFQEMVHEAQQSLAAALNQTATKATRESADRPVRSVQEGRETRAGPSAAQTESRAFKRWFGDSKVVDEKGKPLVVYHGTNSDITAFEEAAEGVDGIFFSAQSDLAQEYADWRSEEFGGNSVLYAAYLSMKNPLVVEAKGRRFEANWFQTTIDEAKRDGHDGVIFHDVADGWTADKKGDTYVAFKSSQIKSATGNRGTFDPDNPNILYRRKAKEPESPKDPLEQLQELDAEKFDAVSIKKD